MTQGAMIVATALAGLDPSANCHIKNSPTAESKAEMESLPAIFHTFFGCSSVIRSRAFSSPVPFPATIAETDTISFFEKTFISIPLADPFQLLPLYGITDNYIENLTKNPAGFGTSHLGEEPDGATSDGQQLSDQLFPQGDRHRLGPVFGFQLL
jgi:hypothetical protein